MREGVNTHHILVNLVIADEVADSLSTHEREEQRKKLKDTFSTDALLRKHVTTFMITYNNTVSDAVSWKDTKQDILRGE